MNKIKLNPHEQAVAELERWEEQGIRNTFDPELVVMADLYPSKFYKEGKKDVTLLS